MLWSRHFTMILQNTPIQTMTLAVSNVRLYPQTQEPKKGLLRRFCKHLRRFECQMYCWVHILGHCLFFVHDTGLYRNPPFAKTPFFGYRQTLTCQSRYQQYMLGTDWDILPPGHARWICTVKLMPCIFWEGDKRCNIHSSYGVWTMALALRPRWPANNKKNWKILVSGSAEKSTKIAEKKEAGSKPYFEPLFPFFSHFFPFSKFFF